MLVTLHTHGEVAVMGTGLEITCLGNLTNFSLCSASYFDNSSQHTSITQLPFLHCFYLLQSQARGVEETSEILEIGGDSAVEEKSDLLTVANLWMRRSFCFKRMLMANKTDQRSRH